MRTILKPAKARAPYGSLTVPAPPPVVPNKEDAVCCTSRRDDLGRLPIGFCSDTCERRRRR